MYANCDFSLFALQTYTLHITIKIKLGKIQYPRYFKQYYEYLYM